MNEEVQERLDSLVDNLNDLNEEISKTFDDHATRGEKLEKKIDCLKDATFKALKEVDKIFDDISFAVRENGEFMNRVFQLLVDKKIISLIEIQDIAEKFVAESPEKYGK